MQSNLQHHFAHQPITANSQTTIQKEEKKDNREIDFISQFLELSTYQSSLYPINASRFRKKIQINTTNSQTIERSQSNQQSSMKDSRFKSVFHNFQKHLVVTLRASFKLRISHKRDPIRSLAFEMWKIFLSSQLTSKKVLHFLFGVIHLTTQENYMEVKNYSIAGCGELLRFHAAEQVAAAQEYLRREIIHQGYEIIRKDGLSHRRMTKSDEFQSYFVSFLQQLQSGPLSRRLPKSQKLEIIRQIIMIQQETL